MNILQVIPAFDTGGVEEEALTIANAISEAGHGSFIASAGGRKVEQAKQTGSVHFTQPLNKKSPFLFFRSVKELSKIIQENNINIVHARSRWPAWCAFFAAKKCNVIYMTTFHGAHKSNNFIKKAYNAIMVSTNHVIAVSNFMENYIRSTYAKTLNQFKTTIHTIPRGIDEARFYIDQVKNSEVDALKRQWDIEPGIKVILLPARMTRLKGHQVLIDALCKIKSEGWIAIFLGADDKRKKYQDEIIELIKKCGLNSHIKIIQATDNMPAAYRLSDAVVLPTTVPEAFGRVVIEAQAMGVPIIASNLGEPSTLISHGITGWKFDNQNSDQLAEMLDLVLNLDEKNKHLYQIAARQNVLKNYTNKLMCFRTIELYERIHQERQI